MVNYTLPSRGHDGVALPRISYQINRSKVAKNVKKTLS